MKNISIYYYSKKKKQNTKGPGISILRNVSLFKDLKLFISFCLSELHNILCISSLTLSG